MAIGWPPWSTITFLPLSLSQVKALSGLRPVRKKPSFSLIWAKCTAGGFLPCSSGREALRGRRLGDMHGAVGHAGDAPICRAAETECLAVSPSCFRKPPAKVAISGE